MARPSLSRGTTRQRGLSRRAAAGHKTPCRTATARRHQSSRPRATSAVGLPATAVAVRQPAPPSHWPVVLQKATSSVGALSATRGKTTRSPEMLRLRRVLPNARQQTAHALTTMRRPQVATLSSTAVFPLPHSVLWQFPAVHTTPHTDVVRTSQQGGQILLRSLADLSTMGTAPESFLT